MRRFVFIVIVFIGIICAINAQNDSIYGFQKAEILEDIYSQLTENDGSYPETLMEELTEAAQHPVDINHVTEDDLVKLRFLNSTQIKDILVFVSKHPLHSLNELWLIPSLKSYEARNLCAFVMIDTASTAAPDDKLYFREVFHYANHELFARVDARNIETCDPDPVYVKARYNFNYKNRVRFGYTLTRQPGSDKVAHGGYLQLNHIGPLATIVAGNYQAHFGQGLVLSRPFHTGKSNYVLSAGMQTEELSKYTSTDGQGLHGIGATGCWDIRRAQLKASLLYSLNRVNDSLRVHRIGANVTAIYDCMKIGVTAVENIYSDSMRYYYENAAYNQHYFRGDKQAVLGLNGRFHRGIIDIFGEVAAAQNQRWGWGMEVGSRLTPIPDIGLILLYRYYSPFFDNTLGYAFSESSRLNDENGLYAGLDIRRLSHWRFSVYGDVFRFAGIKYGIPYSPSWGYDAMLLTEYIPNDIWNMNLKLRAREKAKRGTYSARYQFNWTQGPWHLRTCLDGNLVQDSLKQLSYGWSLYQDIHYTVPTTPIVIQARLQYFDARNWNNRIYNYENDVLYAYSFPEVYGEGFRAYLNFRWKIIKPLSLYMRVSETLYTKRWRDEHGLERLSKTDIHFVLRATL